MQSIEFKIVSRIYGKGRGWCFTPKQFLDLGSRQAVDLALSRLTQKNTIRRLTRGLYDYPRTHQKLGLLSPDPNDVARALAHRDATRLQPSGAYAANLLGLSEQVPAKIVFLTDGPERKVKIGNQEILLKNTTPRNMATAGRISGTIFQALKSLGKHTAPEHTEHLRKLLSSSDKAQLQKDKIHAPIWMHPVINAIVKD